MTMGDNPLYGVTCLYIGDKPVDVSNNSLVAFDPGKDGENKSVSNVWQDNKGSITLSFTITSTDNPLGRWYKNMCEDFKKEKKALFYALTHGYFIRVYFQDEDGKDGYFDMTRPRHLRMILKRVRFIPRYRIFKESSGYTHVYVVHKGKLKPHQVWPSTDKMIEKFEKEYMKSIENKEG